MTPVARRVSHSKKLVEQQDPVHHCGPITDGEKGLLKLYENFFLKFLFSIAGIIVKEICDFGLKSTVECQMIYRFMLII